jgi:hypothetical protein
MQQFAERPIFFSLAERHCTLFDHFACLRHPQLYRFEDLPRLPNRVVVHTTGKNVPAVAAAGEDRQRILPEEVMQCIREKYRGHEIPQIGAIGDVDAQVTDCRGIDDIWEMVRIVAHAGTFIGTTARAAITTVRRRTPESRTAASSFDHPCARQRSIPSALTASRPWVAGSTSRRIGVPAAESPGPGSLYTRANGHDERVASRERRGMGRWRRCSARHRRSPCAAMRPDPAPRRVPSPVADGRPAVVLSWSHHVAPGCMEVRQYCGGTAMPLRVPDPALQRLRRRLRHAESLVALPGELQTTRAASRAVGALALGALAVGALAIGALAIGRLAIGRARIRRLEIDELVVGQLRVTEELRGPPTPDPEN